MIAGWRRNYAARRPSGTLFLIAGADAASARIANRYFLEADGDGNVVESTEDHETLLRRPWSGARPARLR
jgi:hypothetical protein